MTAEEAEEFSEMNAIVKVRLATADDAFEIATMSQVEIEYGLPWRFTPERIARCIASSTVNVAVVRDESGLAAFGIMAYADEVAHLILMAVRSSCRRRGIGTSLVAWLEEVARTAGISTVRVEARKENAPALALYGKCGYREVADVLGMYFGIDDGICLEKEFFDSPRTGRCPLTRDGVPMNIKDIVKDNQVRFLRYRQGQMYYSISVPGKAGDFMFPVALSDVGDATLGSGEKAILFMRYIRKAIEEGTFVPIADEGVPRHD
jgi:[ribosomal protein S18]-alanine N-acetyltransferase